MPKYREIEVALNELAALERKLKNPGGPVEDLAASYAVRVSLVALQEVQKLVEQEITVAR